VTKNVIKLDNEIRLYLTLDFQKPNIAYQLTA